MVINALIDLLIGFIPIAGDLFDLMEGQRRNLAFLERHAHPGSAATRGDWIFVLSIIGVLLAVTVISFSSRG
jgi:hypothetical protein